MRLIHTLLAAFLALSVATPALAQRSGGRASGLFGGSFGDGGSHVAAAASAGYRVTRHFGFEIEFGYVPRIRLNDIAPPPLFQAVTAPTRSKGQIPIPVDFTFDSSAREFTFVSNFVVEFPTALDWFRPYVLAGGGLASLRRTQTIHIPEILSNLDEIRALGIDVTLPTFTVRQTETDLALDAGGGLEFGLGRSLALSGDVRYFQILAQAGDVHTVRVGARISYRF